VSFGSSNAVDVARLLALLLDAETVAVFKEALSVGVDVGLFAGEFVAEFHRFMILSGVD
jgi:hypothetical protein